MKGGLRRSATNCFDLAVLLIGSLGLATAGNAVAQITYNQGTLQLSGTIHNVADSGEAKDATWCVHELWSGKFQRAVSLPIDVDVDQAEASFEHGIVKIVLPKAEQARPKSIPITTNGQRQAISSGT